MRNTTYIGTAVAKQTWTQRLSQTILLLQSHIGEELGLFGELRFAAGVNSLKLSVGADCMCYSMSSLVYVVLGQ